MLLYVNIYYTIDFAIFKRRKGNFKKKSKKYEKMGDLDWHAAQSRNKKGTKNRGDSSFLIALLSYEKNDP